MRRFSFVVLLGSLIFCVRAKAQNSGMPFNWGWANGPYGGHVFRIATLVQNFNTGAADHLHIVAIANYNDYSGANATIDATFANRGSFAASYTVRGAPVTYNAHLAAYQDSAGAVEIYFMFASAYVSGSYTVLENFQESVETNPPDLGDVTPPGTLVWDSANPADTQHYIGFNGNTGIGTQAPDAELSINTSNPGFETGIHVANPDPTGFSVLRLGPVDTSAQNAGFAVHAFNSAWGGPASSAIAPSTASLIAFDSGGMVLDTLATAPIRFFTSGYGAGNERMRIDPYGNVGIGTTTPSATLEVNGNMKADGNFIFVGPGGGAIYGDGGNTVLQAPVGGNVYLANVGVDGTRVSQSDGSLRIGGPGQPSAALIFPTGPQTVPYTGGSALTSSSNGNVGIGTSSPGSSFSVSGGISVGVAYAALAAPANGAIFQGNVGLGTTTPGSDLTALSSPPPTGTPIFEVNGDIAFTQGPPGVTPKQTLGGSLIFSDQTVQSTAWNGTTFGQDYAEEVVIAGERGTYEPGDLIAIDEAETGTFHKASEPYSRLVAGVFSTKPGLLARRSKDESQDAAIEVPMAMIGLVPTKVCVENGPVRRGDLLVSSSKPGYAMKGTDPARLTGAVIGKALAPLEHGCGLIQVLIALQ